MGLSAIAALTCYKKKFTLNNEVAGGASVKSHVDAGRLPTAAKARRLAR
jgi:hypothetical protein